jgi:hypothetical protein
MNEFEQQVTDRAKDTGDLGAQAAVRFLIAMELVHKDVSWIGQDHAIQWDEIDYGNAWMSSGQQAGWVLAYSMVRGLIGAHYWRLDLRNQAAFRDALAVSA